MTAVLETHLSGARLSRRGKVRELYDLGDTLLLVASDRISAFDCVLSPGVPDKGKILTQLSNFWFQKFSDIENHLLETAVERFPGAVLVPLSAFDAATIPAPPGSEIVFACRSGRRSATASFAAQEQGFAYDAHMAGGLLAWKAAGLPTET